MAAEPDTPPQWSQILIQVLNLLKEQFEANSWREVAAKVGEYDATIGRWLMGGGITLEKFVNLLTFLPKSDIKRVLPNYDPLSDIEEQFKNKAKEFGDHYIIGELIDFDEVILFENKTRKFNLGDFGAMARHRFGQDFVLIKYNYKNEAGFKMVEKDEAINYDVKNEIIVKIKEENKLRLMVPTDLGSRTKGEIFFNSMNEEIWKKRSEEQKKFLIELAEIRRLPHSFTRSIYFKDEIEPVYRVLGDLSVFKTHF
jgi:hypothetical protein